MNLSIFAIVDSVIYDCHIYEAHPPVQPKILTIILMHLVYFVKRSDVTGNRFEWQLGENKVI